jgi:hypothetical protein
MDDERIDSLLNAYFDGALSAEDAAELERRLLAEPQARARFWELARFHAALREWGCRDWGRQLGDAEALASATPCILPDPPVYRPPVEPLVRRWKKFALPLAAAIALGMGLWIWFGPWLNRGTAPSPSELPESRTVAVLTRAVDAVWEDNEDANLFPGAALTAGKLRLRSGKAQVDFASGAQFVLDGPAELQMVSETEAVLIAGTASAQIPAAIHGFRLQAGPFQVTDADGDFGIRAGAEPQFHVLAGRARVRTNGEPPAIVAAPAALAYVPAGARDIPVGRGLFTTAEQFAQRDYAARQLRYAAWRQAADAWNSDPSTLLHFTFESQQPWETTLKNRTLVTTAGSDGSIVGAKWCEGRWAGKRALEFRGKGDRVRFNVPGQHKAVTCLMWVFVEELTNPCHSLLHSEAQCPGEVRWSINSNGAQGVAIRTQEPSAGHVFERVTTGPRKQVAGRWVCLGLTYDSETGRVAHYADGHLLFSYDSHARNPAVFGVVELANWGVDPLEPRWEWAINSGPRFYVRNFRGRIDEVLMLNRALDLPEIRRFYEDGQPNATTLAQK